MVNDEISESEDEYASGQRSDLTASFTTDTKKEFLLKMKKKWREERNLKNFYKIEMIFGFQMTLQISLLYAIVLAPVFSGTDAQTETDFPYPILILKYICSIILHMTMQPRVLDAIERLYFIKRHPHKFDRISIPLAICCFKLCVELMTEFVSMALIAACADCSDVVMNYIALGVISELDSVYFATIRSPLKQQLKDMDHEIPITNVDNVDLTEDHDQLDKFYFKGLKLIKFWYEAIYFHSFPYLLFLFIFINHYVAHMSSLVLL